MLKALKALCFTLSNTFGAFQATGHDPFFLIWSFGGLAIYRWVDGFVVYKGLNVSDRVFAPEGLQKVCLTN
jgi:hypothetical protein